MAYNIEVFELIACNDDRIVLTMPFNMTDLRGIGMPNVRLNDRHCRMVPRSTISI